MFFDKILSLPAVKFLISLIKGHLLRLNPTSNAHSLRGVTTTQFQVLPTQEIEAVRSLLPSPYADIIISHSAQAITAVLGDSALPVSTLRRLLDSVDDQFNSLIHHCVRSGLHSLALNLLSTQRIDVSVPNLQGYSPLLTAGSLFLVVAACSSS